MPPYDPCRACGRALPAPGPDAVCPACPHGSPPTPPGRPAAAVAGRKGRGVALGLAAGVLGGGLLVYAVGRVVDRPEPPTGAPPEQAQQTFTPPSAPAPTEAPIPPPAWPAASEQAQRARDRDTLRALLRDARALLAALEAPRPPADVAQTAAQVKAAAAHVPTIPGPLRDKVSHLALQLDLLTAGILLQARMAAGRADAPAPQGTAENLAIMSANTRRALAEVEPLLAAE